MSAHSDTPSAPETARPAAESGCSDKVGWPLIAFTAFFVGGVSLFLFPQWRHNPDLPHGWFMPLIFVLLVHEARTRGTPRFLKAGQGLTVAVAACTIAGLCLLTLGCLYMAMLEWTHALVVLMITGALCAFLTAFWLVCADKGRRWVPVNWPAGMAVFLWLLSIPLPPGTYATITQSLQGFVTHTVLRLLHFGGIAAIQQGNILQLTDVTVGVEEACSGIRSLLSCLYTGLFLSATLVRRPWARIVIIGLSGPLAVAMNVLRSLTLTLLAHGGASINGAWHDTTGYAVLATTAVLLGGLALWLERRSARVSENSRQSHASAVAINFPANQRPKRIALGGAVVAVIVVSLLLVNLRPARMAVRPAPDLAALLPVEYPGWTAVTDRDLERFSPQLQTTHLAQTTYQRQSAATAEPLSISVYLAYWPAGTAPVSVVATHTPDSCLPGAGWVLENSLGSSAPTMHLGLSAQNPFTQAEHRIFSLQAYRREVWFWHIYDGRVIHIADVRSPKQLLFLALRYGFRKEGEQLFVRVISNQPLEKIVNEPILQEIFTRLAPFGL